MGSKMAKKMCCFCGNQTVSRFFHLFFEFIVVVHRKKWSKLHFFCAFQKLKCTIRIAMSLIVVIFSGKKMAPKYQDLTLHNVVQRHAKVFVDGSMKK